MLTFKELGKIMSKFFDDIEAAIKNIHVNHGVDNETVVKEINEAVASSVAPLQSQITDLQGQIAELQKVAQDTVAALQSGDTEAALAAATSAAGTASGGASSGAA